MSGPVGGVTPESRYIGQALRIVRDMRGLKTSDAATAAGVADATIRAVEGLGYPMRLDRMYKLLRLYRAPVTAVLPPLDAELPVPPGEIEVAVGRAIAYGESYPMPGWLQGALNDAAAQKRPHHINFMKDGWDFRYTVDSTLRGAVDRAKQIQKLFKLDGITVDNTHLQGT